MGFGTTLFTSVYFSRQTFRHKSDVIEALEEVKQLKKSAIDRIRQLTFMTEPRKFFPIEEEDMMSCVQLELDKCLEELDECNYDIVTLQMLLDEWEKCHDKDGRAICTPKDMEWDASYLEGDFLDMVYPDGTILNNDL